MEILVQLAIVIVTLACVLVGTQPARPSRRMAQGCTPSRYSTSLANACAYPCRPRLSHRGQGWGRRRDLQLAVPLDHVAPGASVVPDPWPPETDRAEL